MTPTTAGPTAATGSGMLPLDGFLRDLHARVRLNTGGRVADYIPELGLADPRHFGICIVTVDGQVYAVGDTDEPFTIQSMSKPFAYGQALETLGAAEVLRRVGVEPTGESFNSIVLDDRNNRPFNPMVNAGAIVVSSLLPGADVTARETGMVELFSRLAGRTLTVDEDVFASEDATGHRNRAIAWMMLNSGMIDAPPEDALRVYFRQCSVQVTCRDIATMAATLANRGVNPATRQAVFSPETVRDVLTVMSSCGMYDFAGQWAFDVGLPAKSGVSGGIVAVIPGQAGVAVWSPPLDPFGNSVRGIEVCKALSRGFALHGNNVRVGGPAVIRREYRASRIGSKRLRPTAERDWLAAHGDAIAVIEAQGPLYFGSADTLVRRILALATGTREVVVDFRRASQADAAAEELLRRAARQVADLPATLTFTRLAGHPALAGLHATLSAEALRTGLRFVEDTDTALERAENALLATREGGADPARFALWRLDLLAGLSPEDYRLIEGEIAAVQFPAGAQIIREGDAADVLFIVARGTASVSIALPDGRRKRLGSIGPGFSIGEMALIEGGRRSADVFAEEAVTCYGLSVARLRALAADRPSLMTCILGNLARILAHRLRTANEEIRQLE